MCTKVPVYVHNWLIWTSAFRALYYTVGGTQTWKFQIRRSGCGLWVQILVENAKKNHKLLLLVPCFQSHKIRGTSTKTKKMKFIKGGQEVVRNGSSSCSNFFHFGESKKKEVMSQNLYFENFFKYFSLFSFLYWCHVFCATESRVPIRA